jgi:hypothetical protein
MTTDDRDGRQAERRWRLAAALLAVTLLPLMLWASRDFGVTWDEIHRQANGERIWLLYQGIVRAPATPAEHLYGGLFDVLAVALQPRLPFDLFDTRHLLNAFFGWLGMVGCGLIGLRAGGGRVAFFAIAALAAWPSYFGHSMNNPKDIPFAALATLVLAALAWLPTRAPYLPVRHVLALGGAIGLTLGVRPGGLLFLGYAGLWVAATLWIARETDPRRLATTLAALAGVALLACVVPMPVWPYLWERPVVGILEAVEGVSHYAWYGTVLFDGKDLPSTNLPWTYVPVWLGMQTPLVLQAGAAATIPIFFAPGFRRKATAGLWFAVVFPIAYVIARESTLYDGIRHLLFVMPPLAVLAALGWDDLIRRARGRWRAIVVCLAVLGISEPLVFQIRNHPNQTVYFQPLVGGPSRAYSRFEMDYWGNCLYQALRETAILADATHAPVTVSGRQDRQLLLNARRVPEVAVVSPRLGQHELEITILRGRRADLRAFTVRDDIVWWVKTADGARLCAVQRGPQFERLAERLHARGLMHLLPRGDN